MSGSLDRRAFLRRVGAAGLVAPTMSLVACDGGGPPSVDGLAAGRSGAGAGVRAGAAPGADAAPGGLARPVLLPWSGGAVHIDAPLDELPMAYVSRALRRVFVDFAFRDRSNWVLKAHISVSSGFWRIPLPGDPVGQPIMPGDRLREFEELDIASWDPNMEPALGDFRIRRGAPVPVRVAFACVPMGPDVAWYGAGPWDIRQCDGLGEEACREDCVELGVGTRHPIRGCVSDGVAVPFVTWASPE